MYIVQQMVNAWSRFTSLGMPRVCQLYQWRGEPETGALANQPSIVPVLPLSSSTPFKSREAQILLVCIMTRCM